MKFSGGYVAINPNFVMTEMPAKEKIDFELEGVIAVLRNILLRGAPTKPSVFLKESIGEVPKTNGYIYTLPTKELCWNKTIKGGTTNPAVSFYEKLTRENPEAFCFLPECKLNEIIYDEKIEDSYAVDFYSPFHRMVIEIDGTQHNEGVQKIRDNQRDRIVGDMGLNIIRITTKECTDEILFNKIKKIMQTKTTLRFLSERDLLLEQKAYMYVFRFQILLLELFSKGYLVFEKGNEKISVHANGDEELIEATFKIAYDDLKCWIENLGVLLGRNIQFPQIEMVETAAICVDVDIYNRYDDSFFLNDEIIKIRNDYFPYDKDSFAVIESRKSKDDKVILNKFCQYKNYYKVNISDFRFNNVNENNECHKRALTFLLKNIFNHDEFRPKQLEIVANGLNDQRGIIGLLPTGSGKSVCYQLVSFLTPAITLVITPLKLLMNDQKQNLFKRNLIMSSYQIHAEENGNINVFANGQAKILYVSPERFFNEDFCRLIKSISIGQVVIDEVHCLSEWGHDFRTSYLLLFSFLKNSYLSKKVLLMGTSATASPRVIHDIKQEFGKLKDDVKVIKSTSISRPELCFDVIKVSDERKKKEKILEIVENGYAKGDKILIFCAYKGTTLDIQLALNSANPKYKAHRYYSGILKDKKCDDSKEQKEKAFVEFSNGTSKVMAATKAFGMGIDIQDIRQTIHFDIASSVESMYQEMGRAGRDGKQSRCTVLYLDKKTAENNINKLFEADLSIEKLKKEQENSQWLDGYGVLSRQLCLLIRDNKDYIEWSQFVFAIYQFLIQSERKEEFELISVYDFLSKNYPELIFEDLKNEFEKALYKLYTLGIIDLWNVTYPNGQMGNPIYSQLNVYEFSQETQLKKLESHIARYGGRGIKYASNKNDTLESYIIALCKWDNENFLNYRWKSLQTLYRMVSDFKSSEVFASRIEKFFLDSDKLESVIINPSGYKEWVEILFETESDTLLYQLERYSLDFPNNPAIEFLQGMIAIKNSDFRKEAKQKFKNVLSEIFSKTGIDNSAFVSDCLSYFDNDFESKKRYLIFLADNFPAVIKHKEAKKYLKSFDESIANELLDRPTYNSIYTALEKLKLTLGDKK